MKSPPANLTTPQAVMRSHGGELTFWLAWLSDELHAETRSWFREQARRDPVLLKDLESIDRPVAREQMRNALEVTNYPARDEGNTPGGTELTGMVLKDEAALYT